MTKTHLSRVEGNSPFISTTLLPCVQNAANFPPYLLSILFVFEKSSQSLFQADISDVEECPSFLDFGRIKIPRHKWTDIGLTDYSIFPTVMSPASTL
ncbi:hypothetical protein I7I53_06990 [Histoplasma capsulatum var. duboisii H88]|uniref:Uncharacterized protein n=1 Tax=Ajellomyces capsulatus (strain H88) TaxID=544711 RepID=A0A8A1LG59_AJEC8|nr:hypothetical protein I7I53_06990 [Histoplasma capsulatum var. duboisii H88]